MTKTKSLKWKPPVFKHFRSTDLLNAFVLNALVTATIATLTLVFDDGLDQLAQKHDWKLKPALRRFIAFVLAFIAGLACYLLMYFFLGFGGGMLTNKKVEFIN
jgi:hypothetical protein